MGFELTEYPLNQTITGPAQAGETEEKDNEFEFE